MSSQKTQASEAKITLVVDFFGGCTVYFAANSMLLKMTQKTHDDEEKLSFANTFSRGLNMESYQECLLKETIF